MKVTIPKKEWIPRVLVVATLTAVTIVSVMPLFVNGGRESVDEALEVTDIVTINVPINVPMNVPANVPMDVQVRIPAPPTFTKVTQSLEEEEE